MGGRLALEDPTSNAHLRVMAPPRRVRTVLPVVRRRQAAGPAASSAPPSSSATSPTTPQPPRPREPNRPQPPERQPRRPRGHGSRERRIARVTRERPFVVTMQPLPAPSRPRGLVGRIFLDREHRLSIGWRLLCYLTLVMAAT